MGWASGFEAGTKIGKSWVDTYRDTERRRELERAQAEINGAKTPSSIAYSPEQGENLRKLSEQGYTFEPELGPNRVPTGAYNIYSPTVNKGSSNNKNSGSYAGDGTPPINANNNNNTVPNQTYASGGLYSDAKANIFATPSAGTFNSAGMYVPPVPYNQQNIPSWAAAAGSRADPNVISAGLIKTGPGRADVVAPIDVATLDVPKSTTVESLGGGESAGGDFYGRSFPEERGLQPLSKQQRDAMLLERYADIIAKDDPVRAAQLRLSAAQEARSQAQFDSSQTLTGLQIARETRTGNRQAGLDQALKSISDDVSLSADARQKAVATAIEQFEGPAAAQEFLNKGTSAKINETTLSSAQRILKEGELKDKFNAEVAKQRAANPNYGYKEMQQLATTMGLPLDLQDSYVAAMANINKNSITMLRQEVESKFAKFTNFRQAIAEFNTNDKLDPDTDLKERAGPDGSIVIDLVDKKGNVLQKDMYTFRNAGEALSGLYQAATNPAQMGDWVAQSELRNAEVGLKKGQTKYYERGGRYGSGGGLSSGGSDSDLKRADTYGKLAASYQKQLEGVDEKLRELGTRSSPKDVLERDALTRRKNDLQVKIDNATDKAEQYAGGGLQRDGGVPVPKYDTKTWYPETDGKTESRYTGKGDINDRANWENRPISAAPAAAAKPAAPAGNKKNGVVDVTNDPVLKSLRESVAKLDPNNPADSAKMIAYGTAKNERIAELQKRYGALSELKTD